jgi:outer membrane lipoprotein SlyB
MRPFTSRLARIIPALLACVTLVNVQGCAYQSSSADVYTGRQAQREAHIRLGVVESTRPVKIQRNQGEPSGFGAIGGGLVGAVAGSAIGGGRGSLLTGIGGGIAGALAGNAVEQHVDTKDGVEITVRLDNGSLRAITQEVTPQEIFRAGDRVRLLTSGGITRVTH